MLFCFDEIDFTEHFFYLCKVVKPLWKEIEKIAASKYGKLTTLSVEDILFGVGTKYNSYVFLNTLIFLGKQTVSRFKYGKYANLIILFEQELQLRNLISSGL